MNRTQIQYAVKICPVQKAKQKRKKQVLNIKGLQRQSERYFKLAFTLKLSIQVLVENKNKTAGFKGENK